MGWDNRERILVGPAKVEFQAGVRIRPGLRESLTRLWILLAGNIFQKPREKLTNPGFRSRLTVPEKQYQVSGQSLG